MDTEDLNSHLARLHAELESAPRTDAETRRLLDEIAADLARLRARAPVAADAAAPPMPDATLPDRLEALAVRFEAEHPTLAASSRRLVDLLGKVGI